MEKEKSGLDRLNEEIEEELRSYHRLILDYQGNPMPRHVPVYDCVSDEIKMMEFCNLLEKAKMWEK